MDPPRTLMKICEHHGTGDISIFNSLPLRPKRKFRAKLLNSESYKYLLKQFLKKWKIIP
jgi:hypothetical protein